MRRFQVVAVAGEGRPEQVLWTGVALDPEDALRQALASGARLALGRRSVLVREEPAR